MNENFLDFFATIAVVQAGSCSNNRCDVSDCRLEITTKRKLMIGTKGSHLEEKKPHPCTFPGCGKSFLRPAHLLIHNRIHTGEKPYMCEYHGCGKRWNQKSALKQHMRTHTGEKPFTCPIQGCSRKFSTSSSCKRHLSVHNHTDKISEIRAKDLDWNWNLPSPSSSSSSSSSESDSEEVPSPIQSNPREHLQLSVENIPTKMNVNFILNWITR